MSGFEGRCRARIRGGSGINAVPSRGVRPGHGHADVGLRSRMPRTSTRGEPYGETRASSFPRGAAEILCPRFPESGAPEKAPGSSLEMQAPRPRGWQAGTGARRGPASGLFKNLPGDSDAGALWKPSESSGGRGTTAGARSRAPRRREERPGARPGLGAPTPQQQRMRLGHPGRETKSPRFRTRLRTPASTSRQTVKACKSMPQNSRSELPLKQLQMCNLYSR